MAPFGQDLIYLIYLKKIKNQARAPRTPSPLGGVSGVIIAPLGAVGPRAGAIKGAGVRGRGLDW